MENDNKSSMYFRACRACLATKYTDHVRLNTEDWLEMYKFCIDTEISEDEKALILCIKCAELLRGYAEFKRLCKQSEAFWETLLNKTVTCNSLKLDPQSFIKTEKPDLGNDEEQCYDGDDASYLQQDHFFKVEVLDPVKGEETIKVEGKKTKTKKNKTKGFIGHCNFCSKVYRFKGCLITHLKTCNQKKKGPTAVELKGKSFCGICNNNIEQLDSVHQHLLTHYKNNDLTCKLCDHTALDFAEMMSHRYQHQPAGLIRGGRNYPQQCFLCTKRCFLPLALEFHFRKRHLAKPAGGYCRRCDIHFDQLLRWNHHERLHTSRAFQCDECDKRFPQKSRLLKHVKDSHQQRRDYVCEECGHAFKRKRYIKVHMQTAHAKSAAVPCSHCARTFKSRVHLDMHLRWLSRERPHVCTVCSKRYTTPSGLKLHMFLHTGAKPFVCETCGRRYKKKFELKQHLKSHIGLYSHKCTECDKAFHKNSLLKRHMSVHTGVRRYKCSHCDKSFHTIKMLNGHYSKRHGSSDV